MGKEIKSAEKIQRRQKDYADDPSINSVQYIYNNFK